MFGPLPVPTVEIRHKRPQARHVCDCGLTNCRTCRNRIYSMNAYRRRKAGIPPVCGGPHSAGDRYAMGPDVDMGRLEDYWRSVAI